MTREITYNLRTMLTCPSTKLSFREPTCALGNVPKNGCVGRDIRCAICVLFDHSGVWDILWRARSRWESTRSGRHLGFVGCCFHIDCGAAERRPDCGEDAKWTVIRLSDVLPHKFLHTASRAPCLSVTPRDTTKGATYSIVDLQYVDYVQSRLSGYHIYMLHICCSCHGAL